MERIFIALKVKPGESLLRIHSSLIAVLGGERINWTYPSNIHLTLAFLGNTEDDLIKIVSIMLKQKCTGFGEFSFTLKETGVFKNYHDPRVIWIGIENNETLMKLYDEINTGLKDAGFKTENRPFRPHITLGRIKSIRNTDILRSSLEKYQNAFIQEVLVREVILFESILNTSGPEYRPEGRFILL
ncbi:MAG: RNA 2',3'-cyclic phosphodiesterase [Geobacter sp.]|nr:MAG: RNA 2',3'-cyclic phosphodiesterase [Geobacter sp.]